MHPFAGQQHGANSNFSTPITLLFGAWQVLLLVQMCSLTREVEAARKALAVAAGGAAGGAAPTSARQAESGVLSRHRLVGSTVTP
jgi:hypothetical protein